MSNFFDLADVKGLKKRIIKQYNDRIARNKEKAKLRKKKENKEVSIVLEFTDSNTSRVHSLYNSRIVAEGRAKALNKHAVASTKAESRIHTFHVITKKVKGKP
jgi:phosphate starvation-inducible protein PhoH